MKRNGLAAALLVASSSYCYSEVVNGITNNAASGGNTWSMDSVLPPQTGLTVGGVYYRYTIEKDPNADAQVHIQNENAIDGGLLFRNTDDWSGLPGNTIVNRFSLPNIPKEYFGDGSIEVEGSGEVTDANIFYTYTFDTCADPLSDPSCPGYEAALADRLDALGLLNQQVEVNDPLDDEFVQAQLEREVDIDEDSDQAESEEEDEEEEIDMEAALAAADNALAIGVGAAELSQLSVSANLAQFANYMERNIPGGVYNETVVFEPKELPDNRQGLRVGLAQQVLHEQMVDSQYQLGDDGTNE